MDNKQKYRLLCEQEKTIPVFNQAWWLDAVCGEANWDICLVEKGGQIFASMPYYMKHKYGFNLFRFLGNRNTGTSLLAVIDILYNVFELHFIPFISVFPDFRDIFIRALYPTETNNS